MVRCVPVFALLLAVLVVLAAAPALAGWDGPPTELDQRRLALLLQVDAHFRPDGTETAAPQPNHLLKPKWGEHYYLEDALAILTLIEAGETPATRAAEANAGLRFMLWQWPTHGASVVGQYPPAWNHRSRSLAMRLYLQYRDLLEPDIRAEFEARIDTMVTDPFTQKSENIKITNNAAIFLAHELRGATHTPSWDATRTWTLDFLRKLGKEGEDEWGSGYHGWTLGAVLNLADFAEDPEVRHLATLVLDMYCARQAAFQLDGHAVNGGVRRYPHSVHGTYMNQSTIVRTMFVDTPIGFDTNHTWLEWATSNYRPLAVVDALYADPSAPLTAAITVGDDWRYTTWRSRGVALTVSQSPDADHFVQPSGGTHDIVGVYIQSAGAPGNGVSHVVPYGYPLEPLENGPGKRRNAVERYFGYQNIAFAHHGGTTRAVWAGGVFTQIPIRLFYTLDFAVELEGGWAFLHNGTSFVAWAPTLGDPALQTGTLPSDKVGRFLVSSHRGDDQGEVGVLEVGDTTTHASYAAFKNSILTRGRPRWQNGAVTWTALDGTAVRFTATDVFLDDQRYEPTSHPRAQAPGLDGYAIGSGTTRVTLDLDAIAWHGPETRVDAHLAFPGFASDAPPPPPTEPAPARCADGIDNDADSLTDFPDDPDCTSPDDDDETGSVVTVPVDPVTGEARLEALLATGEFTVDGHHDEVLGSGTWAAVGEEAWHSDTSQPWSGIHGRLAARWAPEGLFFAATIEDHDLAPGDALALGLDPTLDGGTVYGPDDLVLAVELVDTTPTVYILHGATTPDQIPLAITREANTTRYELFVPASELGQGLSLHDGQTLGFTFLVKDVSTSQGPLGWTAWTDDLGQVTAPDSWGELALRTLPPATGTPPEHPTDPSDPPTTTPDPNNPSDPTTPSDPNTPTQTPDPETNPELDPIDGACTCSTLRSSSSTATDQGFGPLRLLAALLVLLGLFRASNTNRNRRNL